MTPAALAARASAPGKDVYERVAELVERILDAPASPRAWARVLAALCAQLPAGSVALLLGRIGRSDAPVYLMGHGIDMRRVGPEDLMPATGHPSVESASIGDVLEIPAGSPHFAESNLFRNVLAAEGLAPGPGLSLVLGRDGQHITGSLMVLSRDPAWQPRDEDRTLLTLLAPYLIRGITLGLRLNERRAGIEALLGSLDALVLGVLLLDERGNLSFANRSAAELIGIEPGLCSAGQRAQPGHTELDEALRALSRGALAAGAGAHALVHPRDGRLLHVVAAPLDWKEQEAAGRFATALFIGDPACSPVTAAPNAFAALYGLTPSEERLTLELARGRTLAEAAEQCGIRLSTARGVLSSVFSKTGTHRQASLVRLVLMTAGQVRPEAPGG